MKSHPLRNPACKKKSSRLLMASQFQVTILKPGAWQVLLRPGGSPLTPGSSHLTVGFNGCSQIAQSNVQLFKYKNKSASMMWHSKKMHLSIYRKFLVTFLQKFLIHTYSRCGTVNNTSFSQFWSVPQRPRSLRRRRGHEFRVWIQRVFVCLPRRCRRTLFNELKEDLLGHWVSYAVTYSWEHKNTSENQLYKQNLFSSDQLHGTWLLQNQGHLTVPPERDRRAWPNSSRVPHLELWGGLGLLLQSSNGELARLGNISWFCTIQYYSLW